MYVTLILIATFRPQTAGLHQAIVSIYWVGTVVPLWLLVISVSQTSLIVGGFPFKALLVLWEEETDPSAVRCVRYRLSCCLIVGIWASGISILQLSLLMLLGWSLMWIASLTLRDSEYQWGSCSINLTSFQRGECPVLLLCLETAEVWVNSWKPYFIPIVLLNPFMHAPFRFANV